MPDDIREVVQRMIDAGEPEEAIAAVIRGNAINQKMARKPTPGADQYKGPTSFSGGLQQSLFGGEAIKAGLKGGLGWLKGATLDIPDTIGTMLSDAGEVISHPIRTLQDAPSAFREGLPAMGRQFADVAANAGSDPEAFGRMMGQLTGQPIVMEGARLGAPMVKQIPSATSTAVSKTPLLNKLVPGALEPTGRFLEGTRAYSTIPTTPKGIVARTVGRVVSPVGTKIREIGENIRLKRHGVQPANDLASAPFTPAPENPYVDIFERSAQRNNQVDPMFQDIPVETSQELAARGGGTKPASPFISEPPVDIDPMFRRSQPDPQNTNLTHSQPVTPEDQMAAAIQEVRDKFAREGNSRVEAPPPPYSLGAGSPPEQPRVSVRAPKSKPEPRAKTTNKAAEPTPIPNKTAPEPGGFTKEDIELVKARREELKAALKKMAEQNNVDPNTGEMLPTKRARNWNITSQDAQQFASNVDEEMGFSGDRGPIDFANDEGIPENMFARRYPGDEAIDLGDLGNEPINLSKMFERPTANMPDWGPETVTEVRPKTPVNPARPQVPPGQVTNKQMFELSERRGLENKLAGQSAFRQQPDPAVLNEFSQDMMLTPEEMFGTRDLPVSRSPVENVYDPRTSNIDMTPTSRTIQPEEWGDWGGAEKDIPTLVPDETGSHVAAPAKKRPTALDEDRAKYTKELMKTKDPERAEQLRGFLRFIDSTIERRTTKGVPGSHNPSSNVAAINEKSSFSQIQNKMHELFDKGRDGSLTAEELAEAQRLNKIWREHPEFGKEEMGYSGPEQPIDTANDSPRLVSGKTGKTIKELGPKGEAFRVTGPNGNHLGDISITEKQIQEIMDLPVYEGVPREEVVKAIHDSQLEDILEKHGLDEKAKSRVKIEAKNAGHKRTPTNASEVSPEANIEGLDTLTDYSGTGREPRFPGDKPKGTGASAFKKEPINPDEAFGPGGDIGPIAQEAIRLNHNNAVDSKYRSLLPKEMRTELGPGETYKGKLQTLLQTIQEENKMSPEAAALKLKERDTFLDSVRNSEGIEPKSDIPLLNRKAIDLSKLRPGKLDQPQSPWISPRLQQQFPDLARRLKNLGKKKN